MEVLRPVPPAPPVAPTNGPLDPSANGEHRAPAEEPEPNRVPPDDSPSL